MSENVPTIVVFISGRGSNLKALIDAVEDNKLNAKIIKVVSNRKNALGLEHAKKANILTETFSLKSFTNQGKSRIDFDIDVSNYVKELKPDLVILAGFMHILSPEFLKPFPDNIINLHPALPGQYDGAHAIERAFQDFKEGKIKQTGIMVHKVIAAVDQGEVIIQKEIPIEKEDSLETLEERIHEEEHQLIVEGARIFLEKLNSKSSGRS